MAAEIISTLSSTDNPFDPSNPIGDSPFSVQWVLDNLTASDEQFISFGRSSKVIDVKARDISEGKGFMSKVYKIDIQFENSLDYSVVLKVPGAESLTKLRERTSASNDEDLDHVRQVAEAHNREVHFYNEFAPHLDIPLPKIYKSLAWDMEEPHQRGAVLMESFFGRAETMPISNGVSVQQLFALAKHMATLHAYFLTLPSEKFQGLFSSKTWESNLNVDFFGAVFHILSKRKPGLFDKAIRIRDVHKDAGLPLILTHGDLWTNNILWKKRSDGSLSYEVAAIIDWQVLREGCMTYDVAEFMAVCADGEIRREYEDDVLQCYYDRIVEEMGNYGKKVDFGMDQLKMAYKANFIVQAMMTMAMAVFLFPDLKEDDPRPRIQNAQAEKLYLRAQLAAEEAMDYLKNISVEKLTVNA
ncbi:hypothetical protein QR680_014994 [Steinernema hermaphroditum]|uniref:CHK kinase-like domain-containing protein n=1 Tax=Steinernema hermaphroditum TaxID=289476 RepID=A0AA39IAS8_9BILA|nr:hypothetical protein QR680_014994 [Steinernema hermaphroditum]